MTDNRDDLLPPMPGDEPAKPERSATQGQVTYVSAVGGDLPILVEVDGARTSMSVADALALAGRILATVECWARFGNG